MQKARGKAVRIIVKFLHSDFILCRKTLMKACDEFLTYKQPCSFSTLLDMSGEKDQLSDDGFVLEKIAEEYGKIGIIRRKVEE